MKLTDLLKKNNIDVENATTYDLKKILGSQGGTKPKDVTNTDNIDTETLKELLYKISSLETKIEIKEKENEALKATIAEKDTVLKGFESEKVKSEEALKAYRERETQKAAEEKTKSIDTLINDYIQKGKLAPKNEKLIASIKKVAEVDLEEAKTILESYDGIAKESPKMESKPNADQNKFGFSSEMQTLTSGINPAILERITQ